jgi:hypothetical protein
MNIVLIRAGLRQPIDLPDPGTRQLVRDLVSSIFKVNLKLLLFLSNDIWEGLFYLLVLCLAREGNANIRLCWSELRQIESSVKGVLGYIPHEWT